MASESGSEEADAVYLERFYRRTPEGVAAAKDWGAEAWTEDEWQAKFEKVVAAYKKKADKARKKGAVGPAADFRALLYGALQDKYGIDPRALSPPKCELSLVPDGDDAEVAAPVYSPHSSGGMTPEERAEALVQRFSALREELSTAPDSDPAETPDLDPAMLAAQVRAQLAAKRADAAAAAAAAAANSRSDDLPPFLTPMPWEAAPPYAPPAQPSMAYKAATYGMMSAAPIDVELFASAKAELERLSAERAEEERLAAERAEAEPAALAWAVALIDANGHATIPASCSSIEPYAFYRRHDLISVTIPASVTHIGEYAFYCTGLQAVELPGSVKSIGHSAFGSTGLTRLGRPLGPALPMLAVDPTPSKRMLAPQPEPEPEPEPSQAHTAVHVLLGLQAFCIYVPRLAMPLLVPFICNEYAFTEMAKARLLGAFFPA